MGKRPLFALLLMCCLGLLLSQTASALASSTTTASGSTQVGNSQVTPFSVNVGGGKWNYGTWNYDGTNYKQCWSNYYHPSRYHSSTAVLGPQRQKSYANAGSWSYAYVIWYNTVTGYAYWNTY